MILLFDIGNTAINWASESCGVLTNTASINYKKDDPMVFFGANTAFDKTPLAVLLANVAGDEIAAKFKAWVYKKWQLDPWVATVDSTFGQLKNAYPNLREMGVDRWLAMVAAWEKYKTDLCVVDCGTATTIDLIDRSGAHLGGYIIPGHALMQQSLIDHADGINTRIQQEGSIMAANNTRAAIANGASWALVSTLYQTLNMYQQQIDRKPLCVLTGGKAGLLLSLLDCPVIFEPNLVLIGLTVLYKSNR